MNKVTPQELKERLAWSLPQKIDHSLSVIEAALKFSDNNAFVSFSGGKDSTILLFLARIVKPDMQGVFFNTTNEFPEICNFVRNTDNVLWINPNTNLKKVIEKYGFPLVSKEQALYIREARTTKSKKLYDKRLGSGVGSISHKWRFLLNVDFDVSEMCCQYLKKGPSHLYQKETKSLPIIGSSVEESLLRWEQYIRRGCNAFEDNHPASYPLSIWTQKDKWDFIHENNIPYCELYDKGMDRTDCMICGFGCQHDSRFELLKKLHPKVYQYGMNLENHGVKYGTAIRMIQKGPYKGIFDEY